MLEQSWWYEGVAPAACKGCCAEEPWCSPIGYCNSCCDEREFWNSLPDDLSQEEIYRLRHGSIGDRE